MYVVICLCSHVRCTRPSWKSAVVVEASVFLNKVYVCKCAVNKLLTSTVKKCCFDIFKKSHTHQACTKPAIAKQLKKDDQPNYLCCIKL